MKTLIAAWVLGMLQSLEPKAPWKDTYPSTAEAFAESAVESPLFAGADGPKQTASLLVSVAWFEGRLNPRAVGDHGTSVCIFQINDTNWKGLGVTRDELLDDIGTCTRAASQLLRQSMKVCSARPDLERLGWYAAGGADCGRGQRESQHRVLKAKWLFAHQAWPADATALLSLDPSGVF